MPSSRRLSLIIEILLALVTLVALVACSAAPAMRPPSRAEFEEAKGQDPTPKETPEAQPARAQTPQTPPPNPRPSSPSSEPTETPVEELIRAQHVMTILAVTDLAHAARFYAEVFAWPKKIDTPRLVSFQIPGGVELALYDREGFALTTGRAPQPLMVGAITGTEIYLHHPDPEEVIERLERHGARRLSPLSARPWGDEAAYYADPDGNVIGVGRPLPKDTSTPAIP
jgi:predicted enzyme related to lactoylglutathione lyase